MSLSACLPWDFRHMDEACSEQGSVVVCAVHSHFQRKCRRCKMKQPGHWPSPAPRGRGWMSLMPPRLPASLFPRDSPPEMPSFFPRPTAPFCPIPDSLIIYMCGGSGRWWQRQAGMAAGMCSCRQKVLSETGVPPHCLPPHVTGTGMPCEASELIFTLFCLPLLS